MTIAIDGARLRDRLERLSTFGRPAGGSFEDGVTRLAYSDADIEARAYVTALMAQAGLSVVTDAAGNIIGRRAGSDPALRPILVGSHIDTVPAGGNFDGALGSLAAIEITQAMADSRVMTRHPIEVVIWSDEEGAAFGTGLFGSRAAAGLVQDAELDQQANGTRRRKAIQRIGGDAERFKSARWAWGSVHAYLELHIEQGPILDKGGVSIGVVEGIVVIDRYRATVRGAANHAGTTPMADRRDALVAASQLVAAVRGIMLSEPGQQVGTVGRLVVNPNAANVVPGLVELTIEPRDLSEDKVSRLAERVNARAAEIAAENRTPIEIEQTGRHVGALCTP